MKRPGENTHRSQQDVADARLVTGEGIRSTMAPRDSPATMDLARENVARITRSAHGVGRRTVESYDGTNTADRGRPLEGV